MCYQPLGKGVTDAATGAHDDCPLWLFVSILFHLLLILVVRKDNQKHKLNLILPLFSLFSFIFATYLYR